MHRRVSDRFGGLVTTPASGRPARWAGSWAVSWIVTGVLAGLLAMHGLGEHGVHDYLRSAAHGGMAAPSAPVTLHDPVTQVQGASLPPGGHHLGADCVLRPAGPSTTDEANAPVAGSNGPVSMLPADLHLVGRGRDPEPPDLLRLSVFRC